jgi:hypothetical protein
MRMVEKQNRAKVLLCTLSTPSQHPHCPQGHSGTPGVRQSEVAGPTVSSNASQAPGTLSRRGSDNRRPGS